MLRFLPSTVFFLVAISTAFGLEIQATPLELEAGVTRYLTVKCLALKETGSTMETIISLVISRSDGPQNAIFQELASINVFHVDGQVIHNVKENQTSEGKIDNNGLSYLTLVWEFPDTNKAGVYVCQANGVNFSGHPVSKNSLPVIVQSTHPGVDTLVNQMKNVTTQMEQMHILVNGLENFREMWIDRLQSMKTVMFSSNDFYYGHRYYLSYEQKITITHGFSAVCEMFGGYLVEIDSADELRFVGNFVNGRPEIEIIIIGITDEQNENQWINIHSGTLSGYIQFGTPEPNGGRRENCGALRRGSGWQMVDIGCSSIWDTFKAAFICEVRESI